MKKNYLKQAFILVVILLGLNNKSFAQCSANFTYTVGSSGSVAFTNTSSGVSGGAFNHWSFGDGLGSSVSSPTHTFTYNGTYYVNLMIGDTLSNSICDSSSQVITITNGISCNIAPSFSYSAGSNGQINFTSTSANVPGGSIYYWSFDDGESSSQVSPTHTYYYSGTYTVNLTIHDSIGYCYQTTSQTVTVSNGNTCNLNVGYTYVLGSNGQVSFTNTSTGVDTSAHTYWYFGDGVGYSYQNSPSYTFSNNGTYYVNLSIGDSNSVCHGVYTDTIIISNVVLPPCVASFTDSMAINGSIHFTNTSTGFSPSTIFTWNFGVAGSGMQGGFQSNFGVGYQTNGVYQVTLQLTDSVTGCSSTFSDSVVVTNAVPPPCNASVSFIMHQDSLNPQPGIWQVSTYYSPDVTSAVWSWGDGTSTNGLSPTHTYTSVGQYNICVVAYASCGDSAYICQNDSLYRSLGMISVTVLNVNGVTGIKTVSKETAQVSVYPNPSNGVFMLNLSNVSTSSKAQINITNILGEVVYSTQETVNNNALNKEMDLQNLANGAYFMKVVLGDKTYTNKLIKN